MEPYEKHQRPASYKRASIFGKLLGKTEEGKGKKAENKEEKAKLKANQVVEGIAESSKLTGPRRSKTTPQSWDAVNIQSGNISPYLDQHRDQDDTRLSQNFDKYPDQIQEQDATELPQLSDSPHHHYQDQDGTILSQPLDTRLTQTFKSSQTYMLRVHSPIIQTNTDHTLQIQVGGSYNFTSQLSFVLLRGTGLLGFNPTPVGIFMSPSSDKFAVLYKDAAHIFFLRDTSCFSDLQPPALPKGSSSKIKWQSVRLAGGYAWMKGKIDFDTTFVPYQLPPTVGHHRVMPDSDRNFRTDILDVEISAKGDCLFRTISGLELNSKRLLANANTHLSELGIGEVIKFGFGFGSRFCFAFQRTRSYGVVYVWDCLSESDIPCKVFEHLLSRTGFWYTPVRDVVFLPLSAGYVLWRTDNYVSIIRNVEDTQETKTLKVEDLITILVTPNEDALVFIKSTKITAARIYRDNRRIGKCVTLYTFETGQRFIATGNKCSATVLADPVGFTLYIGWKSGKMIRIACMIAEVAAGEVLPPPLNYSQELTPPSPPLRFSQKLTPREPGQPKEKGNYTSQETQINSVGIKPDTNAHTSYGETSTVSASIVSRSEYLSRNDQTSTVPTSILPLSHDLRSSIAIETDERFESLPAKAFLETMVDEVGDTPSLASVSGVDDLSSVNEAILSLFIKEGPLRLSLESLSNNIPQDDAQIALSRLLKGYCVRLRDSPLNKSQNVATQYLIKRTPYFASRILFKVSKKDFEIADEEIGDEEVTLSRAEQEMLRSDRVQRYLTRDEEPVEPLIIEEPVVISSDSIENDEFSHEEVAEDDEYNSAEDRGVSTEGERILDELKAFFTDSIVMDELQVAVANFATGKSIVDWEKKVEEVVIRKNRQQKVQISREQDLIPQSLYEETRSRNILYDKIFETGTRKKLLSVAKELNEFVRVVRIVVTVEAWKARYLHKYDVANDQSIISLGNGWKRVRSKCDCGHQFQEDIFEHEPNAAAKFLRSMNRGTVRLDSNPTREISTIRHLYRQMKAFFSESGLAGGLPLHIKQTTSNTTFTEEPNSSNSSVSAIPGRVLTSEQINIAITKIFICFGISKFSGGPYLYHDSTDSVIEADAEVSHTYGVRADQDMFQSLHTQYYLQRPWWSRMISCVELFEVKLYEFKLFPYSENEIDVYDDWYDRLPKEKTNPSPGQEWLYHPSTRDMTPFLSHKRITHFVKKPQCAPRGSYWWRRVPKKAKMEVSCSGEEPQPGWGLIFKERWSFRWYLVLWVPFVVFSLLTVILLVHKSHSRWGSVFTVMSGVTAFVSWAWNVQQAKLKQDGIP